MNLQEALDQYGLKPPEIIWDGKMRRFHHDKKIGKKNGWIIVHPDGHGGAGVWGTDVKVAFNGKDFKDITPEDRQRWKTERLQRQAEEKEQQKIAAIAAVARWGNASPAGNTHPYLVKKGVKSYGLRVANNNLLIPMKDDSGQIVNVQSIWTDGTKLFEKGASARGCYYAFGKLNGEIYIGEGYATCATVHEATGHAVVVAFNANNLENIAQLMRRNHPNTKITIIADNDQGKKKSDGTEFNPGLEAAIKASEVGATVIMPDFTPEEGARKLNDFNDLAQEKGPEAVRQALQSKPIRRSVDYISPLPHAKSGGKPMSTVQNLEEICNRLGATVRYNIITRKYEISVPGVESVSDIYENAAYGVLVSECARFNFPTDKLDHFLTVMAGKNAYNPVTEWILSKNWDGISRKQEFFDTVQAANDPLKEVLMSRWMLQAIGGAFEPTGVAAQGILVFQGAQDLGKTSWLLSLLPPEMRRLAKDGVILRLDDKDSILQCICYWLVELGELEATFKKSDVAQLKAFITSNRDVVRAPYGKNANEYPRRTVFFASVNPQEFLSDTTGNRRFWTIQCEAVNWNHDLEMQQVWREFYEDYRAGESWHLTSSEKEMLNDGNTIFESGDPVQDRIGAAYDWSRMSEAKEWKTATDICMEAGIKNPTKPDINKAAAFVRKMNGGMQDKKRTGLLLLVPPSAPLPDGVLPESRHW